MTTMQDPITKQVSDYLGMTPTEADRSPATAARRAAKVLRANGYVRKYCHHAWNRGYRWFYAGSDVPERDLCATSLLGVALIDGRISKS